MMSIGSLDVLVRDLQAEIERGLIPQTWIGNQGPETTLFAPLDLSRTVLKRRIRPLFRAISDDRNVEGDAESALLNETSVCRILAILLYIPCDTSILQDFRSLFTSNSHPAKRDSDLPLEESAARNLFGDNLGRRFYRKQFTFCPVVLKEDEEVKYMGRQQWCRLPIIDHAFLGSGSSGYVSKITIPRRHFYSSRGDPNSQPQIFAWKEFKQSKDPKKDYELERNNLRLIKGSGRPHPNILLETGGLLRGSMYSLYFEAAEYDLDKYLKSGKILIPQDGLGVYTFLRRFRGLVSALRFLHNELVSAETSEKLQVAHLDLKPNNILVFMGPPETWKIHDFGRARVSKRHHKELRGLRRFLPMAASDSSSGTTIPRSGSFLAPETHVGNDNDMGQVKAVSDVWSLGCILSLVISFLDEGPLSITNFENERKTGAGVISDHFYVRNKRNNHVLNPGVKAWFEKLDKRFSVRERRVLLAIQNIISLLENRIFLVKPDDRATSDEMESRFDDILSQLNAQTSLNPSEAFATKPSLSDKFRLLRSKEDKVHKDEPKQYDLPLLEEPRRSKFSNCGEYLAFLAPKSISFYETRRILKTDEKKTARMCGPTRAPRSAKPPKGSTWVNFEISSIYLVAVTDHDHFDCYLYRHSAAKEDSSPSEQNTTHSEHNRSSVEQNGEQNAALSGQSSAHSEHHGSPSEQNAAPSDPSDMRHHCHFMLSQKASKIHKMVLSPDSKFLVHVLQGLDQMFYIYLSRVDDMISWRQAWGKSDEYLDIASKNSFAGSSPKSQSDASRTYSKGSIQSLGPLDLPWKHILLNRKAKLEISHVQALQFSADSQLFTFSSEPPNTNECKFYAWTTANGKYVNSLILDRPGNIDTSQVWITGFTPLMPKLAILAVTFQRVLCQCSFVEKESSWKSAEMNIQLLDILPLSNSDDRCLFIGREKRRGGTVKALYVERKKLKDKISRIEFQYTIDLECEDWIPGRDSAATLDDGHLFMIARVDDTGFVRTFIRPNAPTMASR